MLLTGFGPFGDHRINASWESVKLLNERTIDNYRIKTIEIPVVYDYVEGNVELLWKTHDPKLVVHVGVSNFTDKLQLETQAFRTGFGVLLQVFSLFCF